MKENRYDDQEFFDRYAEMARSRKGLSGAGEWPVLKEMLPDLQGCRMLDLGCGYGWHCRYAVDQGASAVVGIDISNGCCRSRNSWARSAHHLCADGHGGCLLSA